MCISGLDGALSSGIIAVHVSAFDDNSETVSLGVPLHGSRNLRHAVVCHRVGRVFNIPNSYGSIGGVRSKCILCSSVPLACHHLLGVSFQLSISFFNMTSDPAIWDDPQLS